VAGRAQPGGRGDVDDRTAAALPHRGEDELRGEYDGAQVQVERVPPPRRVRRREGRFLEAPGVVHQHADRARGGDGRAHARLGPHVRGNERPADPRGGGRAGPLVPVGDDHAHAFGGEPLRDPAAYPVRASRHQSGHSFKVHYGSVGRGTDISFPIAPGPAGRRATSARRLSRFASQPPR
jgi:hypothetical protein